MEERVNHHRGSVERIEAAVNVLLNRVSDLEDANQEKDTMISGLRQEIEDMRAGCVVLEGVQISNNTKVSNFEDRLQDMEDSLEGEICCSHCPVSRSPNREESSSSGSPESSEYGSVTDLMDRDSRSQGMATGDPRGNLPYPGSGEIVPDSEEERENGETRFQGEEDIGSRFFYLPIIGENVNPISDPNPRSVVSSERVEERLRLGDFSGDGRGESSSVVSCLAPVRRFFEETSGGDVGMSSWIGASRR